MHLTGSGGYGSVKTMQVDWGTVVAVAGVLLAGLTVLNRRIDRRFDAVDRKFESTDRKFESIDRKFDAVDRKFDAVDRKFESIDQKFERRFEVVEQQIRALAREIANLRQDVGRLQGVVERAYEPDRFTHAPARVRERRPPYGSESPGSSGPREDEPGS